MLNLSDLSASGKRQREMTFPCRLDLPRICGERFKVYAACLSN
jgi:hypothetical protein